MAKMSIDNFKREVSRTAEAARASARVSQTLELEATRKRISCSASGIAAIWGAAVLHISFDKFPRSIDLSSSNGHNAGLSVSRAPQGWQIDGSLDVLRRASTYGIGQTSITHIVPNALKAMDIPHSPEAYRKLAEMMKWRPGLLFDASEEVPRHVVAATVGQGTACLRMFGIFGVDWGDSKLFFDDLSKAASAMGRSLSTPPAQWVPPPLLQLAAAGDAEFLSWALASRLLEPNVVDNGRTAAMAAVDRGNLVTLRTLHRAGERLDVTDASGETLLHLAGRLVTTERRADAVDIAKYLIGQGLDPQARNTDGQTPSDVAYPGYDDDELEASTEVWEKFDRALSHGQTLRL